MSITTLDLDALRSVRASRNGAVLLDVGPADVYTAGHIPGARHACVYEMVFIEQVAALIPDKETPVIVYGSGVRSLASATAAEKLERAGYAEVYDFREGLAGWKASGQEITRGPAMGETPVRRSGTFRLDTEKSRLGWVGRNLANQHHGELPFQAGRLRLTEGLVVAGDFVIDMHRISCRDIADTAMNNMLIQHLESDDFFDVARFPVAEVTISGSRALPDATPGMPNLELECLLTLKGVKEAFSCAAAAGFQTDTTWVAQAHFDLDRTLWNVLYGSGKFYDHLGMHLVNDLVSFQLVLVADRAPPGIPA